MSLIFCKFHQKPMWFVESFSLSDSKLSFLIFNLWNTQCPHIQPDQESSTDFTIFLHSKPPLCLSNNSVNSRPPRWTMWTPLHLTVLIEFTVQCKLQITLYGFHCKNVILWLRGLLGFYVDFNVNNVVFWCTIIFWCIYGPHCLLCNILEFTHGLHC